MTPFSGPECMELGVVSWSAALLDACPPLLAERENAEHAPSRVTIGEGSVLQLI